jgi:hypothetical protein
MVERRLDRSAPLKSRQESLAAGRDELDLGLDGGAARGPLPVSGVPDGLPARYRSPAYDLTSITGSGPLGHNSVTCGFAGGGSRICALL